MKVLSLIVLLVLLGPIKVCVPKKDYIPNYELEKNFRLWHEKKISNYNFIIRKTTMGTWSIMPMLMRYEKES